MAGLRGKSAYEGEVRDPGLVETHYGQIVFQPVCIKGYGEIIQSQGAIFIRVHSRRIQILDSRIRLYFGLGLTYDLDSLGISKTCLSVVNQGKNGTVLLDVKPNKCNFVGQGQVIESVLELVIDSVQFISFYIKCSSALQYSIYFYSGQVFLQIRSS